jgi:hypothetical protein
LRRCAERALEEMKKARQRSRGYATAGGREPRLKARPPARFTLRSTIQNVLQQRTENQKCESHRVTLLLAHRIPLPGNSYFRRTADIGRISRLPRSAGISVRMRVRKPVGIEMIGRSADKNVRACILVFAQKMAKISAKTFGDREPGKVSPRLSRRNAELPRRSHLVLSHSEMKPYPVPAKRREIQYKPHLRACPAGV